MCFDNKHNQENKIHHFYHIETAGHEVHYNVVYTVARGRGGWGLPRAHPGLHYDAPTWGTVLPCDAGGVPHSGATRSAVKPGVGAT